MITKITIHNFKSLENFELDCKGLNVLTGMNGVGKSSIIQALLLLRQSHDRGPLSRFGLTLNGDLVNIGTGQNALFRGAEKEEITFELNFSEEEMIRRWVFKYSQNEDDSEITRFFDSDMLPYSFSTEFNMSHLANYEKLPLFTHQFKYLHADRWVKNEYTRSDFNVIFNRNLGIHGELTAHFLDHFGPKIEVDALLCYPGSIDNKLQSQVSAWMQEISPGTSVQTLTTPGIDAVALRYTFSTSTGFETVLPLNTGFGITYSLPVIVALLSAQPGDILVIENPESHLHPKAQSAIGRLMALAGQTGVQVFVETHSDHVLNGVRVAVKKGVPNECIRLAFIEQEKGRTFLKVPQMDSDGRIDTWPKNFFDEWDNNLLELI